MFNLNVFKFQFQCYNFSDTRFEACKKYKAYKAKGKQQPTELKPF